MVTEAFVRNIRRTQDHVPSHSFHPLEHYEVLDLVEGIMAKTGLEIDDSETGDAKKKFTITGVGGSKMYATFSLKNLIDAETGLMLGISNSWDRTLALRVGFGSRVFVCSNGCFFASKIVGRKHTTNIVKDLPALLTKSIAEVDVYAASQKKFFDALRSVPLTDSLVHDFVVRSSIDNGIITAGEIVGVVEEWRKPRYDAFSPRTAWSLHNAYTEQLKRIEEKNAHMFSYRGVALSQMMAQEFALDLTAKPEIEAEVDVIV